jgi:hypothetical protein
MDAPEPPRLEDFGLSQDEYLRMPRLLCDVVSGKGISHIGNGSGVVVGVFSLWEVFVRTDSFIAGALSGVLIGFVAFLLASFLGGVVAGWMVALISKTQKVFFPLLNAKTVQAFRYADALRDYRAKKAQHDGWPQ